MVHIDQMKDVVTAVAADVSNGEGVRSIHVIDDEACDELQVMIAASDYVLLHAAWSRVARGINGSKRAFAYGADELPGCRMRLYVKGEGGPVGCD